MSRTAARDFVRLTVRARDRQAAERALAEAHAAGASGAEERDDDGTLELLLYARGARASQVRAAAVRGLAGAGSISRGEVIAEVDWSRAWRAGIRATVVSERLVIRPSFVSHPLGPGQREVVIDPGTAFGTGEHASTRLALECIDGFGSLRGARVLDIGTGTGVLALAALRLGAGRAVACDVDAHAAGVAQRNAEANGLAARLGVFAGSVDALAGATFDLVVANLLRSELVPLLPAIAARTRPGGMAALSGLLEEERPSIEACAQAVGLRAAAWRLLRDAGGDRWLALVMRRPGERASR